MSDAVSGLEVRAKAPGKPTSWRMRPWQWAVVAVTALLLVLIFFDGLRLMAAWWEREEYSHGYMLPFVAAFLVW